MLLEQVKPTELVLVMVEMILLETKETITNMLCHQTVMIEEEHIRVNHLVISLATLWEEELVVVLLMLTSMALNYQFLVVLVEKHLLKVGSTHHLRVDQTHMVMQLFLFQLHHHIIHCGISTNSDLLWEQHINHHVSLFYM